MRKTYLAILFCFMMLTASAQCPYIAGIFVDACGQENRNEFVFLLNGPTPLNVNNLAITFPTNGSVTVANTNDFSAPSGTSATHIGTCLTLLNNGGVIPPNAPVIIFMSNDVQQAYDFSSWCTQYGTVYLLYRNLAPVTPTFANTTASGGTSRTTTLSTGAPPTCTATFTYNLPAASADGAFYQFQEPVAGASTSPGAANNGCASPPFALLPIKLKSFTAGLRYEVVALNWTTAMEDNVSHFEIEKSTGGAPFTNIARIQATGSSSREVIYGYNDNKLPIVTTYYRLRMVDLDGRSTYSKVVTVKANPSGFTLFNLYPNPASGTLVIEWNTRQPTQASISITDLQGKLLYNKSLLAPAGYNQTRLAVDFLARGTYYLRIAKDKEIITQKFVRQ